MDETGPYRQRPRTERTTRPGRVECPACLLELKNDVRACPGCGVPIATVRCSECFHMNLPESPLCTGCGHQLGLEPVGEPDELLCQDCKRPLELFAGDGGALHDCGTCGGQLVDHGLLEALLARRELYGRAAPRHPPKHNPLESPVRYLRCPSCSDVMTRKNFGQTSGIIVDVCVKDGVWFDSGELPRVLAFVEAGGLELAKRRAAELERNAVRRAELEQRFGALSIRGTMSRTENARRAVEFADAGLSLLSYVRSLLRG